MRFLAFGQNTSSVKREDAWWMAFLNALAACAVTVATLMSAANHGYRWADDILRSWKDIMDIALVALSLIVPVVIPVLILYLLVSAVAMAVRAIRTPRTRYGQVHPGVRRGR